MPLLLVVSEEFLIWWSSFRDEFSLIGVWLPFGSRIVCEIARGAVSLVVCDIGKSASALTTIVVHIWKTSFVVMCVVICMIFCILMLSIKMVFA